MNKIALLLSFVLSMIFLLHSSPALSSSFVWVQISDPHIMKKGENTAREQQLKKAIKAINNLPVDFVVDTGDLVESPSDEAYQNYISITSELDAPLYNVMGNHDDNFSKNPSDYADLYKKHINRSTYYSFDWKGYHLIVLDSIKPGAHSGTFHAPESQLCWLKKDLSEVGKRSVLMFCHHPPTGSRIDVDDYDDLHEIISAFNVRAFYSGHRHGKPLEEFIDNVYFVNSGALSFPLGGSKLGYRINSINDEYMWTAWANLDDPEPIINRRRVVEKDAQYTDKLGESAHATAVMQAGRISRSIPFTSAAPTGAVLQIRYVQEFTKGQEQAEKSYVELVTPTGNEKLADFQDSETWTCLLLPISKSLISRATIDGKVTLVINNPSSDRKLWIDWMELGESTVVWKQLYPRSTE